MKLEVKDYEKMVYVGEPAFCEKTGALVFSERRFQDGRYITEIRIKTGENLCYVNTGGSFETLPGFSPDGTRFSCLSERAGKKKLVLSEKVLTEPNQEEDRYFGEFEILPGQEHMNVREYVWAPEGKRIAWIGDVEPEGEKVPEGWIPPIVATGESYRKDVDGGFKISRKYSLNLYNFEAKEVCCLYEGLKEIRSLSWSEDGKNLFFNEEGDGDCYYTVPAEMGEQKICLKKELYAPLGEGGICSTRDGKLVLAAGCGRDDKFTGYDLFCLHSDGTGEVPVDWQGDIPDEIFPILSNCSPFPEKNKILCPAGDINTWAVIGTKTGKVAVYLCTVWEEEGFLKGNWKQLTDGTGSYSALCKGEEGYLYGIRSDWNHPGEVVKISLKDGSWEAVTEENLWVKEMQLATVNPYQCASLDGKAVLDGWVLEPGERKEEKVPGILLVHGGPLSAYGDAFTMEAQLLCAAGFAVILANPRGSSGYGASYADYEMAFNGTAAQDLLYYMDRVLAEYPWIDQDHMGVAGGSYGGYMAAWLCGHSKRFRAAAVMRGLLSFEFLYLTSQAAGAVGMYEEPRDFQDFLMKIMEESPVFYAEDMDIPMLIMHGEADSNCPLDGAHQLYVAVKDTHPDLPVRMVLFPDTGHNIRAGRLDYYERYEQELVDWMKQYV